MSDWYYTDDVLAQQGPVDESTLLDLNESGGIHAKSLVWKEGMEEWAPFGTQAAPMFGETEEGQPVEIGVCAHSGRIYPVEELIPYGEALIGPEHKDAFVQELMESSQVEVEDATGTQTEYVGFWWRTLSSTLDYMVKMIPSWLCLLPYYIASFVGATSESGESIVAIGIAAVAGMLGMLAFSIWYETWMVGKYQGTLGKLVIGAKVVNADGSRLSHKKAFVRWLVKKPLNYIISIGVPYLAVVGIAVAAIGVTENSGDADSAAIALAMIGTMFASVVFFGICSAIYWMAAFDPEKRTFHDRITGTRVVKK